MRWFGSLLVAAFLSVSVGCGTTVEGELWIDPCLGACAATDVCWDGLCYPQSDCAAPYAICEYEDGSFGCTDIDYDPFNCGGCGLMCLADEMCAFGMCQVAGYTCADAGLDDCVDFCTDLYSDPLNCGACGFWCTMDEFCAAGACVGTCPAGTLECGFGCTDVTADPYNCGACGIECVLGCLDGECE